MEGPLPSPGTFDPAVRRAPKREVALSEADVKLALKNALRYIPPEYHREIIPEFYQELMEHGRIYGYRFPSPRSYLRKTRGRIQREMPGRKGHSGHDRQ